MVSKYPYTKCVSVTKGKRMLISENTSVLFLGYIPLVEGYTKIFCLSMRCSIKYNITWMIFLPGGLRLTVR